MSEYLEEHELIELMRREFISRGITPEDGVLRLTKLIQDMGIEGEGSDLEALRNCLAAQLGPQPARVLH